MGQAEKFVTKRVFAFSFVCLMLYNPVMPGQFPDSTKQRNFAFTHIACILKGQIVKLSYKKYTFRLSCIVREA